MASESRPEEHDNDPITNIIAVNILVIDLFFLSDLFQMANTQVREDQSPNINTQRKNCPKKDNEQENRSSKWKRLRQTLKMLGIQKQNSSPKNGKVIKLRNGYKIIVPDIIITAPEEEKDSDRDFKGQEKLDICTSLEE